MHKIYAQAYYRAHLNWDWEMANGRRHKANHWSKVKNWINKRMTKANQIGLIKEKTRSLD